MSFGPKRDSHPDDYGAAKRVFRRGVPTPIGAASI